MNAQVVHEIPYVLEKLKFLLEYHCKCNQLQWDILRLSPKFCTSKFKKYLKIDWLLASLCKKIWTYDKKIQYVFLVPIFFDGRWHQRVHLSIGIYYLVFFYINPGWLYRRGSKGPKVKKNRPFWDSICPYIMRSNFICFG